MNFAPEDVGTTDQQQELLNQQLARAQAMRQLAASRPAYGWGAGLASGLGQVFGALRQNQMEGDQKALLQKQQDALTGASQAYGEAATPEAQRALAMRMMFGDKRLQGAGQSIIEQQNMAPKLALEQQQVAAGQRTAEAAASPQTGEALRLALSRYGFKNIPAGTPTPTLQALMGTAEKGYAAEQGRLSREDVARITQGYGVPGGGGGSTGGAGGAQPLAGKRLDKALKELGADFDPNGGRAGEFGKNQARINAASRVIALGADEQGNPRDLAPNQMPEMAQSVASLISAGGQGAQAQIEHLLPKSFSSDAAGIYQYLTSEPHGAGQQAFVQQMLDTAKREAGQAQIAIDQTRKQRGAKHQQVILGNPVESARVLAPFGFVLGPDGMPVMKQAAPPPPNPAADALRKKYGL